MIYNYNLLKTLTILVTTCVIGVVYIKMAISLISLAMAPRLALA